MVRLRATGFLALCATVASAQQAAPQAPPARDFGRVLWSNTRGLFSRDNLVPLVAGATATGAASFFDQRVQDYFGAERRAPWIGSAGNILGNSLTLGGAAGIMFYASYRTDNQRYRAMSFDLAQGLVIDAVTTAALKAAIRRDRPDESNHYSFPSGHASATATAATVISYYYPKAAIPAYLVTGFVAFSRIEKNRHWLSDTIAGIAQGVIIGRTVVRGRSIFRAGRLQWFPTVTSQGFTVNASVDIGRMNSAAEAQP
jgi:membrane-associated phospholipid phosphatase